MPEKPYESSKSMLPPALPTEKIESQVDHVEFEASKAQKQSSGNHNQENTRKHPGLFSPGGLVGPARKKARSKVPQRHSEYVESALRQYEEDRAEQEKEEDDCEEVEIKEEEEEEDYYGLGSSAFLPWITDFQNAKPGHSDDSVSRPWEATGYSRHLCASVQDFPTIPRNRYLQEVKPSDSDDFVSRTWETAWSGSQLGASVQDLPRNNNSGEAKPIHSGDSVSRTWETEGPGGTGGQLCARVTGGRMLEPQSAKPNHSSISELRTLPAIRIDGNSGQLGARPTKGRPKKTPATEPDPLFAKPSPLSDFEFRLWRPEGTGGQYGAKDKSARFKGKHARKPESPSSRSEAHNESPRVGVKGPAAGNKDTSQAPTQPQVTGEQGNGVISFEQWDLGDDKET